MGEKPPYERIGEALAKEPKSGIAPDGPTTALIAEYIEDLVKALDSLGLSADEARPTLDACNRLGFILGQFALVAHGALWVAAKRTRNDPPTS
ncbi:MAG TPA: hypothetical protein VN886_21540 [Acidimicrobiales bacterium]|nr:hypothetical protein [Acidimicrobiales bacterium]